jgi:hypothetical protein
MTAPSEGLAGVPERPVPGEPAGESSFDPLKLCIFTTVALLAWIFGPLAVAVFAVLGLAGYWQAHRAGLTRSRCYLRDVRLVLLYLGLVLVAALAGIAWTVYGWLR